jgi:integrase
MALSHANRRALAVDHRHSVLHGADPLGVKQEKRNAATVNDIFDAYSPNFNDKAEVTKAVDRGRIERHLRPLLGRKHAHLVTEGDVKHALAAIRDGKTAVDVKTRKRGRARVRGGEGAARMAIVILSIIFNWAVRSRLMKENRCRFVKLPAAGSRDTILEDAADYTTLFKMLERMERELRIRPQAADAIRMIALTGARRGEIATSAGGI